MGNVNRSHSTAEDRERNVLTWDIPWETSAIRASVCINAVRVLIVVSFYKRTNLDLEFGLYALMESCPFSSYFVHHSDLLILF